MNTRSSRSATSTTHAFPTITNLIRTGYATYLKDLQVFIYLGSLYFCALVLFMLVFGASMGLSLQVLPSIGVLGYFLLIVVGVGALVFFYWLFAWLLLAILYAIKDSGSAPSAKVVLNKAREQSWAFLWMNILTTFIVVGILVLALIAAFIVFGPIAIALPAALSFIVFAGIFISLCVVTLFAGTWFGFTIWMFVDRNARGFHAIALSFHLSQHHFGSIVWRMLLLLLGYLGVGLVLEIVLSGAFMYFPGGSGPIFATLVSDAVLIMFFVPVLGGAFFSLYKSSVAHAGNIDTETKRHGEHRGMLIILAAIGLLGTVMLPISAAALSTLTVSSTTQSQNPDAIRENDLNNIQVQNSAYVRSHQGFAPTLADLARFSEQENATTNPSFALDPQTGRSYTYEVNEGDQAYTACAFLMSGEQYCVSGKTPRYRRVMNMNLMSNTEVSSSTATTSPKHS